MLTNPLVHCWCTCARGLSMVGDAAPADPVAALDEGDSYALELAL